MPESIDAWWSRRRRSKSRDVPYPVGTYRDEWAPFPVLVHQYHPEFNHGITLTQVPPAADVYLTWQCDAGHVFVATPAEQRSRPGGGRRRRSVWCPTCAELAAPRRPPTPFAGPAVPPERTGPGGRPATFGRAPATDRAPAAMSGAPADRPAPAGGPASPTDRAGAATLTAPADRPTPVGGTPPTDRARAAAPTAPTDRPDPATAPSAPADRPTPVGGTSPTDRARAAAPTAPADRSSAAGRAVGAGSTAPGRLAETGGSSAARQSVARGARAARPDVTRAVRPARRSSAGGIVRLAVVPFVVPAMPPEGAFEREGPEHPPPPSMTVDATLLSEDVRTDPRHRPGDAFHSKRAPRTASAAEAELRKRLSERFELDLSPERANAVAVTRPFFGRTEVWPDIVIAELRVAIEYDTVGRFGLEHVGPREDTDRRKDRMLRAVGWEVVRVRCGRLQPLGPYDVRASGVTHRVVDELVDRLRAIRGDLFVNAYLR